jgi:cytosine/adenosine deaminase-related metal-dependent hydrolase
VILTANWVLPISRPPLRHGAVQIHEQRITHVGPATKLAGLDDTTIPLGDVALTPGLVNPHTHLELTCYAGQLPPGPLWDWFKPLLRLRAAPAQIEREQYGVQEGAWQSLKSGVTCVGDISRRNLHWPVLKLIPIRKVCFAELLTIANLPPRNLEELHDAVREVDEDELLTVGISPHASFSVPEDQIRAAITLADQLQRPWCTHWAESPEECAFLKGQAATLHPFLDPFLRRHHIHSPHLTPAAYLERCRASAAPGTIAHGNYFEPEDIDRLADSGHTVVYCPRSHRFFHHAPHPYRALLRAGVNVALGTDSIASNENLSLLEEARFVLTRTEDPPPADQLLRMITLDAARALRLNEHVGSLDPGKLADLAAFPCPAKTPDPCESLIQEAPAPSGVWVAGQRIL